MDLVFQSAARSLPLCRNDLLTEILRDRVYGDISQVWQFDGHILITTDKCRKLFTFDCKPIDHQHDFAPSHLDIPVLPAAVVDILWLSANRLALVDVSGCVLFWRFNSDYHWQLEERRQLCAGAEVTSVAYIPGCQTIVWCEKKSDDILSSTAVSVAFKYSVCQCQLHAHENQTTVLLQNCPAMEVHTLSSNLVFLCTRFQQDQVTVYLSLDCDNRSLTLHMGTDCPTFSTSEPLDFQQVLISNLALIFQTEPGRGDRGVRSDSGQVVVLHSSGQVDHYTPNSGSRKSPVSKSVTYLTEKTGNKVPADNEHWFIHRKLIGLVSGHSVDLFRLQDGSFMCSAAADQLQSLQMVVQSTSAVSLAWVLTQSELFSLQAVKKRNNSSTSLDQLAAHNSLLTDALKLVQLHQAKMDSSCDLTIAQELDKLKDKWNSIKNLTHHKHISTIIAPYLEEYWRLDGLLHQLFKSQKPVLGPLTQTDTFSANRYIHFVVDSRSLTRTDRQVKMIWLSLVYPQELLDILLQGIYIEGVVVHSDEVKRWTSLLGLDGGDLMKFEFVCQLLFQLKPERLLNFVKLAELVSEQTVGASAFVRKTHSLIYYKTAAECLPSSTRSCDPRLAAAVKAQLILASEGDQCMERALRYLLKHSLWLEAVELVKGQVGSEALPIYLHVVMKALADNMVLSDYAVDLFTILPTWKSFLSFSHIASERPEVRQAQLSQAVRDVFAWDQAHIQLGSVRPYLLKLVQD